MATGRIDEESIWLTRARYDTPDASDPLTAQCGSSMEMSLATDSGEKEDERPWRADNLFQIDSRRPLMRAASARVGTDAPNNGRDRRTTRPFSHAINPAQGFSQRPAELCFKSSLSAPLSEIDANVQTAFGPAREYRVRNSPFDSDETRAKVSAMLAATDALKPSQHQPMRASASRMSRVASSRVLTKVSHAWSRLHLRHGDTSSESKQGLMNKNDKDGAELASPSDQALSHNNAISPISTIKKRLNEGDNLNNRKVQKIVGGHVARKPVADDGKSLRSGRPIDDPFTGPTTLPTLFMLQQLNVSGDIRIDCSVLSMSPDPFESEMGFDDGLEDSILSTTPIGSSTPRIEIHRISASTFNSRQSGRAGLVPVQGGVEVSSEHGTVSLELGTQQGKLTNKIQLSPDGCRNAFFGTASPEEDVPFWQRFKKHPSPSKRALEDLEAAFRWYSYLKIHGHDPEEQDELVGVFEPQSPCMSPLDRNKGPKGTPYTCEPPETLFPRLSRVRGGAGSITKLTKEIRLAPPYRPSTPHADDLDELQ